MSDLATQIAVLETQMKNIAKQVDEGFSNNSKEHREIMATFQKALDEKADKKEVDSLADNQKWVIRLIIGLVITALVSLVLIK